MDKTKIDPAVYEKYVDASTALMLEYYSANHEDPLSAIPTDGIEFPAALDARCHADIRHTLAKYRRRKCARKTLKIFGSVVCSFLLTLGLFGVLFISVEAIQVPVMNFFITHTDRYTQFTGNDYGANVPAEFFNPEDPLEGLLPAEFYLSYHQQRERGYMAFYDSGSGDTIFVSLVPLSTVSRYDSENAQVCQEFNLSGHQALLIVKDNVVTVAWVHEDLGITCDIIATSQSEADVLYWATRLMQRVDNSRISWD